nr:hypothetical protein [Janthinobacterium sp. Marseille]
MKAHKSERIIQALSQLEQFTDITSEKLESVLHMLTGAIVSPQLNDDYEEGFLILNFPGGPKVDVIGDIYLRLQIAESVTHELHLDETSKNPIAVRSNELSEHFERKYDL